MPREAVNFWCLLLGVFFPPLWLVPLVDYIGRERQQWRDGHPPIPAPNAAYDARLQAERQSVGLDIYPAPESPMDRRVRKHQMKYHYNPYKES